MGVSWRVAVACPTDGQARLVESVGRRRTQRANGHDDPQPQVGAVSIAPAPHLLDHLARLRRGGITVLLNPQASGAGDVEIGWGHALLDHLVGAG
jgi:hypothetical protein